jgi:cyclophilin family peptidyl-prolyl cis-trans isomerase
MRHIHSTVSWSVSSIAGALALTVAGCGSSEVPTAQGTSAPANAAANDSAAATTVAKASTARGLPPAPPVDSEFVAAETPVVDRTPSARPQIVLHTSRGPVTIELFRNEAPQTVKNFLETYVENGLYSHTVFHHVDAGFIAIAGGYDSELRPVYAGDPIPNESSPDRKNVKGTVAMIRLPDDVNSATSQFFFNLNDNPDFDASQAGEGYCVFGRVVNGLDILDAIAASPTTSTGEFEKIPSDLAQIEAVGVLRY